MGELNHIHQDTKPVRLIAVCKRTFKVGSDLGDDSDDDDIDDDDDDDDDDVVVVVIRCSHVWLQEIYIL